MTWLVAATGLAVLITPCSSVCLDDDPVVSGLRVQELKAPSRSPGPEESWHAFGRVTDQNGHQMAGVEIWAHCGSGTLKRSGVATSGEDGRYDLNLGLVGSLDRRCMAATISAHKPGYFEQNLSRQGDCLAAGKSPDEKEVAVWGAKKRRVFLPGQPLELNFVMRPAGRVSGRLADEQGKPLAGYSVALTGAELPPSSSVLAWTQADKQGRFMLDDLPTTHRFQFEVRMKDVKPPWNDSWASAGLRFEKSENGDLQAWFGDREIKIQEFDLRVAGPGVHGGTATPIAGNAGVLDLTVDNPADVLARTDRLVAAKRAVLTLRNASRPDLSHSLVAESIPVEPAHESRTRLARSRSNEVGEFQLTFENPPGFDLSPDKHQVIFQVIVGVSQKPIRQKIFRQLRVIPGGRYRVPVKIAPEWIDDSRVSITFMTIQPNHNAWVRSFFQEGKGTAYTGLWAEDGGLLPAIPLEAQPRK
jgi:hypothetical protein